MRYLDGQAPDPDAAYGTGMHDMLTLSMGFGVIIGILLLLLALKGRIMWLQCWSTALIAASVLYLVNGFTQWI